MRAFERWLIYDKPLIRPASDEGVIASMAWEAALRWVKREALPLDERGDISRMIITREIEGD